MKFAALLLALAHIAHAGDAVPQRDALAPESVRTGFNGKGRDQITFTVTNRSSAPMHVAIPAGSLCEAKDKSRFIVLQSATLEVPAKATAEALLPAAALASQTLTPNQALRLTTEREPRLDPLLKHLAGQKDMPRATAQFAIFCLLEDMTFARWQRLSGEQREPTPAEIVQAIDVLGLLRVVAPDRTFALANDGELKLRALRNPWCRAKAMQLYGMSLPGDGVAPNIGQLLHTKLGDNCPICRTRDEMQRAVGDL